MTVVIDTAVKNVFVVDSNNTLSIYKFQITNPTSAASPYKPASFNSSFSRISCKQTGLNTFFIITPGAQNISEIRLYNLRGRIISKKANLNQHSALMDVSDAASGIYLLEVVAGGNRYTKQIAIQR
jgi:hypothetical protein